MKKVYSLSGSQYCYTGIDTPVRYVFCLQHKKVNKMKSTQIVLLVVTIFILIFIYIVSIYYGYFFNLYVRTYSIDSVDPFINLSHRSTVKRLQHNWKKIRDEMLASENYFSPIKGEQFFDNIITDNKWKKVYLKWYGPAPKYAYKLYPKTMKILDKCPDVKLAMFSLLEPGTIITPHRGPFRGCIRIHLTLVAPKEPGCTLTVDEKNYSWKEGDIVAFDDTYLHSVRNDTDERRVVLFLDIERKMHMNWINKYVIKHIAPTTTRINDELEKKCTNSRKVNIE